MTPSRTRFGLSVFGLAAVVVFLLSGCSDSDPEAKSGDNPPASTPTAPSSSAPIPTASTPTLQAAADSVEAVADAVGQGHARV